MGKCNYCKRVGTRYHGRHDTTDPVLEHLCELHYFVWHPTQANLEKIKICSAELITIINEYNRMRAQKSMEPIGKGDD